MFKMDDVIVASKMFLEIFFLISFFVMISKTLFFWAFLLFTVMVYIWFFNIVTDEYDDNDEWYDNGPS